MITFLNLLLFYGFQITMANEETKMVSFMANLKRNLRCKTEGQDFFLNSPYRV